MIGTDDPYVVDEAFSVREVIPVPTFPSDEYARGTVGLVVGSGTYPGASLSAMCDALAAGVGMICLNSTRHVQDLMFVDQPGVVIVGGCIQSVLIGSGLGEDRREDAPEFTQFCGRPDMPSVIGAWVFDLAPELATSIKFDTTALTLHYGEAVYLLRCFETPMTWVEIAASLLCYAHVLYEATGCHVILKGPVMIAYFFECVDTEVQGAFQRTLNAAEAWPDVEALPQGRLVCSYTPTVSRVTTS